MRVVEAVSDRLRSLDPSAAQGILEQEIVTGLYPNNYEL